MTIRPRSLIRLSTVWQQAGRPSLGLRERVQRAPCTSESFRWHTAMLQSCCSHVTVVLQPRYSGVTVFIRNVKLLMLNAKNTIWLCDNTLLNVNDTNMAWARLKCEPPVTVLGLTLKLHRHATRYTDDVRRSLSRRVAHPVFQNYQEHWCNSAVLPWGSCMQYYTTVLR